MKTTKKIIALIVVGVALVISVIAKTVSAKEKNPFRMDNLVAWCVVAFDSLERNSEQRIEMLNTLKFKKFAFGGREKHLVTMEQEFQLAKSNGIDISAVWMWLDNRTDQPGKLKPLNERIFKALKDQQLETQIWIGFHKNYFEDLSDPVAFEKAKTIISYLASRAEEINCKIALYNHGGWSGIPENMLQIIKSLPQHNLGMIYNFHHGHDDIDKFPGIVDAMLPYLWCVNLNGMQKGGPKIMTLGSGTNEKQMIQAFLEKDYSGPFGILGHVRDADTKEILKENLNGLKDLFPEYQ